MNIDVIKNQLSEQAKDIKLNLGVILSEEGSPDLHVNQIYSIALACAYATKNVDLINAMLTDVSRLLTAEERAAAKSAATIMAMNNIYYRFVHLVSDKSFATLPAKLRMNVLANPGVSKLDFELSCLAVSAINGCGMCIDAHTDVLLKSNISKLAIQSAIRIAAVMNAVATDIIA